MTKALIPPEIKVKRQHKDATKHFDNTTIADRLRTVSWSDYCHPTGVVKSVNGIPTFPLTAIAVQSKGCIFKNVSWFATVRMKTSMISILGLFQPLQFENHNHFAIESKLAAIETKKIRKQYFVISIKTFSKSQHIRTEGRHVSEWIYSQFRGRHDLPAILLTIRFCDTAWVEPKEQSPVSITV